MKFSNNHMLNKQNVVLKCAIVKQYTYEVGHNESPHDKVSVNLNNRVLFENRQALYFCIIIYLLMPIKHIFIDSVSKILFKFFMYS